jgi:hypothetical protein
MSCFFCNRKDTHPDNMCPWGCAERRKYFVDQEFLSDPDNGVSGDCWRACLASLLAVPRDSVRHFVAEDGADWLGATTGWLRKMYNFTLVESAPEFPIANSIAMYVILMGMSPRNIGHAVLANADNGAIVHDPHPSRDGLAWSTKVFALTHWRDA